MTGSMLVRTRAASFVLMIQDGIAVTPLLIHYHAAKEKLDELEQSPSQIPTELSFLRLWIELAEGQYTKALQTHREDLMGLVEKGPIVPIPDIPNIPPTIEPDSQTSPIEPPPESNNSLDQLRARLEVMRGADEPSKDPSA